MIPSANRRDRELVCSMGYSSKFRGSHQRCSMKKGVLRNFTTLAQLLSCEFYEISKNTVFIEHLWTTASPCLQMHI